MQQLDSPSPLVGTVIKTLHLEPYKASSIDEAVKLGEYHDHDVGLDRYFGDYEVSLVEPVSVDLYQFKPLQFHDGIMEWAKANGKKPILPKHIYAIGIKYPKEQLEHPIVALGSEQHDCVLYLGRYSGIYRSLYWCKAKDEDGYWDKECVFGFLSETTSLKTSSELDSDFDPLTWPNSGLNWE